jgi:hypothetical protein
MSNVACARDAIPTLASIVFPCPISKEFENSIVGRKLRIGGQLPRNKSQQGRALCQEHEGLTSLIPGTSASSPNTQTPGALVASVIKLAAAAPRTFLARRRKGTSLGGVWYEGPASDGRGVLEACGDSEPELEMRIVEAKSSVCMAAMAQDKMAKDNKDRRRLGLDRPTTIFARHLLTLLGSAAALSL